MATFGFKCPVCKSIVELSLNDNEIQQIEEYIQENGKSPTYGAECKNGHTLAVLVSIKKENGVRKAYLRDVFVLQENQSSEKGAKDDSMNWVLKHFGGR